jgi:hypothetical protein
MFLLDTNVVSELRKVSAGRADDSVAAWSREVEPGSLFISVITVQELEAGVLRILRRDPAQGGILRKWLDTQVLPTFESRILPVDTAVARCCASLHVPDPRPYRDSLIAATALVHKLAVVSRNARDFTVDGVRVIDPWTAGMA